MLEFTKCMTCKKYIVLDVAPWGACQKYPDDIPNDIYCNGIDSDKPLKCDEYEFNPDWDK